MISPRLAPPRGIPNRPGQRGRRTPSAAHTARHPSRGRGHFRAIGYGIDGSLGDGTGQTNHSNALAWWQRGPTAVRDDEAGLELDRLAETGDRGAAIAAMAHAAASVVVRMHREGRLDGLVGLGGSGGTSLITHAMRALPLGVPKLMISTVASGDTRHYVGHSDIAMLHSVVDVAGINRISRAVLGNAANAMVGMLSSRPSQPVADDRPLIAATMFGVATAVVEAARARLEDLGYEVLVFHATGRGGDALEDLARAGFIDGVLDLTTTELCDLLVGGVLVPGEHRLTVAGEQALPRSSHSARPTW